MPPGANAPNSVTINPRVVSIPTPVDLLGRSGAPTGTVFNITTLPGSTPGFMVSGVDADNNPTSAPAIFLFATEDGTIVGWNPGVNPVGFDPANAGNYGIIAVDYRCGLRHRPVPAFADEHAIGTGRIVVSRGTRELPMAAESQECVVVGIDQ